MVKDTGLTAAAAHEIKQERRVLRAMLKFERGKNASLQRLAHKVMKVHMNYANDMDQIIQQLDPEAYDKLCHKHKWAPAVQRVNMCSPAWPSSEDGPAKMEASAEEPTCSEDAWVSAPLPACAWECDCCAEAR